MYDLVIIGGSAAGVAAGIYAARRNLHFIVVAKDLGGEVALSGKVNNWPGIIEIQGFELAKNFRQHLESYQPDILEGFVVIKLEQKGRTHIVHVRNQAGEERQIETKAVIVASGIHPRQLGVANEEKLRGKGITYCSVCDGPLFKNRITATIGAGNSALESALMMASISKKVYLLTKYANDETNNGGFPRGENILIDKIKKTENIEIIYQAETQEILGDQFVTGIKYLNLATKEFKELAVDGIMIHVGMVPNTDFVSVQKNRGGEIEIDQKCATSVPGIFAAGDATNIPYKQIAVAAGQGTIAALSAIEYLNKW
ncbi:MAG TPA: FAD-dependent oxidoreductase [Patescibacteria group bacterium]|nr:FAD-dependent oxidoreductase [Patescibacteria group bacterium]